MFESADRGTLVPFFGQKRHWYAAVLTPKCSLATRKVGGHLGCVAAGLFRAILYFNKSQILTANNAAGGLSAGWRSQCCALAFLAFMGYVNGLLVLLLNHNGLANDTTINKALKSAFSVAQRKDFADMGLESALRHKGVDCC